APAPRRVFAQARPVRAVRCDVLFASEARITPDRSPAGRDYGRLRPSFGASSPACLRPPLPAVGNAASRRTWNAYRSRMGAVLREVSVDCNEPRPSADFG